ncbi:MAG: hypothetical protein H6912_00425 [Kordiimonadaceae bacterium]|nr:hypothetical protein [Kordiimonadaceae bacterium]
MLNKSPQIANFIFYLGITIFVLFTVISISYFTSPSMQSVTSIFITLLAVIPALIGLIVAYMGYYMRHKNRKRKFR